MKSDSILIKEFMLENSKAAARALEEVEPEKLAGFFNDTPLNWLLGVFPHMNPNVILKVFEGMDRQKLVQLLESMQMNHLVVSIRMMNENLAEEMLNALSAEKSAAVKGLLHYFDDTLGAHMDVGVLTLQENLSVKEALELIKKQKDEVPPELYIVREDRSLLGLISLSALIVADKGQEIRSMMRTDLNTLSPETPLQAVLTNQDWKKFYTLPVVDKDSLLLGVIKLETIRSILLHSGSRAEETGQLTINALGELYRLGLAGLLRTAADL